MNVELLAHISAYILFCAGLVTNKHFTNILNSLFCSGICLIGIVLGVHVYIHVFLFLSNDVHDFSVGVYVCVHGCVSVRIRHGSTYILTLCI